MSAKTQCSNIKTDCTQITGQSTKQKLGDSYAEHYATTTKKWHPYLLPVKYGCQSVLNLDSFLSYKYVIIFKHTPVWGMWFLILVHLVNRFAMLSVRGNKQN